MGFSAMRRNKVRDTWRKECGRYQRQGCTRRFLPRKGVLRPTCHAKDSGRQVLYAARGFVVVEPEANYPMKAYCETFHMYAKENYNDALMQARDSLYFRGVEFDAYGLDRLAESS